VVHHREQHEPVADAVVQVVHVHAVDAQRVDPQAEGALLARVADVVVFEPGAWSVAAR
jgi:hypothetical protein